MKCFLFLFFLPVYIVGQNELNENQINDLRKNILAYSIKYSDINSYENFYTKDGWQLDLIITQVKSNFFGKDMIFYEVINDNFTFKEINGRMITTSTFSHGVPLYYKLSRLSLIALNKENQILYLGGNFHKSSIANEFNLSIENINLFNNFLKIKLYNYNINNFHKVEIYKKNLLFKCFSNTLNKEVKIVVDKSNFDNIKIEVI
jgi:hypothetical protein